MWQQLQDDDGRTYYFNTVTSESKWEKPESLMTDLEKVLLKFSLKQFENNGSVYYYNEVTQESFWEIPEEVTKEIERINAERGAKEKANIDGSEAKEPEPVPMLLLQEQQEQQKKKEVKIDDYRIKSDILTVRSNNTDPSTLHQMFKDYNVDATWSFNQIISTCTSDPRYWSNSLTPSQKKAEFEEYLKSRSKEELIKENSSIEKFQAAFISLLDNMDIKYYSRWKTVKDKLIQEPIYNLYFISESVKKKTFVDYREALIKDHEEKEEELISQARNELAEYFKGLSITVDTAWEGLIKAIADDDRFKKNKHFARLNQLDLLNIYQEHVQSLKKDLIDQIAAQEAKNYRADRKSREGFTELLHSLQDEGILTADLKWGDLYDFIVDDERYTSMLGRNGSTPIVIFNEFITQENLVINSLRGRIEEILINVQIKIKEDSEEQKSKFNEIVKEYESKLEELNEGRRDIIYEKLIKQYEADQIELRAQRLKAINATIDSFIKEQFENFKTHENVNALSKDSISFPDFFEGLSAKDLKALNFTNNDDIFKHLKLELIKEKELNEAKAKLEESKKRSAPQDSSAPMAKRPHVVKHEPVELDY